MGHQLHLIPLNLTLELPGKDSLLSELKNQQIHIKSSCGGCATCGDCLFKVIAGDKNLTEQTFEEKKLLGNVYHLTKERLACQTKITGEVTIDISLHVGDKMPPKKSKKSKNVLLRKQADIQVKDKTEKKEDPQWFKHWEKSETSQGPKKLGGVKRPKPFNFQDEEE